MTEEVPGVAPNAQPVVENPAQVPVVRPIRRNTLTILLAIVGFAVVSIALLIVIDYLYRVLGSTALTIAVGLAAIPLVIVLLGIRWIDRWEPEPRGALLFAFLWGATASIVIALIFSGISQSYRAAMGIQTSASSEFFETVVQAPIVEETAKGIGILLLFWVMRRSFDGPLDGLVYGATIAIGFAFTENLQYFGLALRGESGVGIASVFLLRAVLSPFAHVMFTACTGLMLGVAARRTNGLAGIGYLILGLVPAVFLHAFWNSAGFWADNWFEYYVVVQVPLFIVALLGVVWLRRHEQRLTRDRLMEYAAAGWFTPSEVNQLSTGTGRRQATSWAARNGLKRPYLRFVQDATHLAFTRERLLKGKHQIGSQRYEAELLDSLGRDRAALAGLPPFPPR